MEILFVIGGLSCGGAEKSLISLLSTLSDRHPEIKVDLLMFKREGLFLNLVPKNVNILTPSKEVECMTYSMAEREFWQNLTAKGLLGKLRRYLRSFLRQDSDLHSNQSLWKNWKDFIPTINKQYDAAISYIEGVPNYFVMDKCSAAKKILFMHTEYSQLCANVGFDHAYFERADQVVTVSTLCAENLQQAFPDLKMKFVVIENIISTHLIRSMADAERPEAFARLSDKTVKIVSVGRLIHLKRFDRAIDAAKILKDRRIRFVWLFIGEGSCREEYEKQIGEYKLASEVIFIGEKRNPYPYMKYADIVVQTSDWEGKSLVIEEAKALNKPIVITNYATAADVIQNEKNGLIADLSPESVADCIEHFISNHDFRNACQAELQKHDCGNETEIEKLLSLLG